MFRLEKFRRELANTWDEQDHDPLGLISSHFKSTEVAFKFCSWLIVIGAFQFIFIKTHSLIALTIAWILKLWLLLLLSYVVQLLRVLLFGMTIKYDSWVRRFLLRIALPCCVFILMNRLLDAMVAQIAASR